MGRADDFRLGVGEQHGRAISGENAEGDAARGGRHAVRLRTVLRVPGFGDGDGLARVDLVERQQVLRCHLKVNGDAGAVQFDGGRIVIGAGAAIEAVIDAGGHAAGTGEEAVADALEAVEFHGVEGVDRHEAYNPAGVRPCEVTAMTLNRVPIASAWVKRVRAASMASA